MIDRISSSLARHFPLRIDQVDYADPTVTLTGDGWSLSMTCPWHLFEGQSRIVSWNEEGATDVIWDLVGHAITEVRPRSTEHPSDPVFLLTGGLRLEIHADTDLDPWVLRLPELTFVGSASRDCNGHPWHQ